MLSVLWGGSFFFNGVVLRELPPLTVVLLRVALAAIMLLPVLWTYRIRFPAGMSGWKPFFVVAFLNNVLPFSLIVTGQTYISSGLASILNATTPLFTVVVMAAAGDERLHARRVAGVVIGLIGVAILHGQELGFSQRRRVSASCSALPRAFSYGLSALYARRKLSNSPPLATATFQMLASSLMMTVVAAAVERPWQLPCRAWRHGWRWPVWRRFRPRWLTSYSFRSCGGSGSTNVMLVTLLIPVTAILLGYLVLGESISLREIVGALVIGSALLLIDGARAAVR